MEYYDVIRGDERERLAHLSPGRIMDAEIARDVFGYLVVMDEVESERLRRDVWSLLREHEVDYPVVVLESFNGVDDRPVLTFRELPFYSSIGEEDIWDVVVAMRRHSRHFFMDHEFGWCAVSFTDAATYGKFNSQNVPEAVCKAALFCVRTLRREAAMVEGLNTATESGSASFFWSKEESFGVQGAL